MSSPYDSKTNTGKYTGGYLPNPLSSPNSSSYYIKLSVVHPQKIDSLVHKANEKIIIAETGATAIFNITDLEIAHVVSWGAETRSANGQIANITITEVNGCRFFDYLIRACEELNIKNYINATYLLEVEFRSTGDDNDGTGYSSNHSPYYLSLIHI